MKKDIEFPQVKGIEVAIVRTLNDFEEYEWYVYLMNRNDFEISNILITSKGYGKKEGNEQKTSVIRQMIEVLAPKSFTQIERIDPELFHLTNEYWVSYYIDRKIFDKKFIFLPETIVDEHIFMIDFLNMEGVLHP